MVIGLMFAASTMGTRFRSIWPMSTRSRVSAGRNRPTTIHWNGSRPCWSCFVQPMSPVCRSWASASAASCWLEPLGGRVDAMPNGSRHGWSAVELSPVGREDPMHKGLPWSMMSFHWNNDCVVDLPPDAAALAHGADGEIQAWMCGVRSYGLQHHPEIDREQVEQWAADDADVLAERGVDIEMLRTDTERHFDEFLRLTNRYFEMVAMLLMPLDRRSTAAAHLP